MELDICGAAYKHISVDANNQRCVNMFPVVSGPSGKGNSKENYNLVLVPTSGLTLIDEVGTQETRSMIRFGDDIYQVIGNSIYRITLNPLNLSLTSEIIGTLTTTAGAMSVAANPTQIMWVDGTENGYLYTPSTGVFGNILSSDADFPGGNSVVFLDGYFIVSAVDSGLFYFSALNNGLNWDPLDVATAESSTDNIVSLAVCKGELWVLGEQSVEIWFNAANVSGAPFSARTGLELKTGCGAARSVERLDDLLIWLDNRGYFVQSAISPFIRDTNSGYDLKIISDEAITAEVLSYDVRSDAVAMSYNDRGHLMYQVSFLSNNKTWVYDYTTKSWHERTSFNTITQRQEYHLAQFHIDFDELHIVSGVRNGKLYQSKYNVYTENGVAIYRTRTTPCIRDDPSSYLEMCIHSLELLMKTGDVPPGTNYTVMMRFSNDRGHTWSDLFSRPIGLIGQYAKPIIWNRLDIAREWMFEFTIVAPVDFTIIKAYLDTSYGG